LPLPTAHFQLPGNCISVTEKKMPRCSMGNLRR
jgi:hypothetical protein